MDYANRSTVEHIYCPAINKTIAYEIIWHYDNSNIFASHELSRQCLDIDKCPLKNCECRYDNGNLILRDEFVANLFL